MSALLQEVPSSMEIIKDDYEFENFEDVNKYFRSVINLLKQMNYSEFQSDEFKNFEVELKELLAKRTVAETA